MILKRAIGGVILSFVFLLSFVYMISGVQWFFKDTLTNQKKEIFTGSISNGVQNVVGGNATENLDTPSLPAPMINAEASISLESDLAGTYKVIFEKDVNKKLPIASLTKLMTAVVVIDNYNLSNNITVDKIADSQAPMKQDVKFGDNMPIESFLDIMLIASSNKSAYALAEVMGEKDFVILMNEKAKKIGLNDTFFADPTGLSPADVSTASDLAKLANYILKNYPRIVNTSRMEALEVPRFRRIVNTDQLLGEIPEAVCSKTGFTPEAKGCLLLVINNTKNNDYLINVVLGADNRFAEMKKLINWSTSTCK